jgi:hypothetical protein
VLSATRLEISSDKLDSQRFGQNNDLKGSVRDQTSLELKTLQDYN